MAQYTINSKYASVVALDTHARSVTAKGIDLATGETKTKRFSDCPTPGEIAAWIHKYFSAPYYAAYESGCTGFHLCRELRAQDIDCDVIAVSTIARSTDDKQRKSDRRDAKRLLRELLIPDSGLSKVWLPDKECEGLRDLLRALRDTINVLKATKQQTTALLLRHGYVFNEKTPLGKRKKTWSQAFMKWLDTLDLGSLYANQALTDYLSAVTEHEARIARMRLQVDEIAQKSRYKPVVDALCCISGIDTYSAMVYTAEIGDFTRFKNGRSISKWTGTTPKSHSSGEHQNANGHITKAGSAPVRTALIEGCSSLGRRNYTPLKLKSNQLVPERIVAECNKCNRRLIERHRHLTEKQKKTANVAKVAIANEMIRWIWAIGCMVQAEQAA
jgi:transposase